MSLNNYFNIENSNLYISPDQASHFAKTIANDFNPLHDPSNRRFCVPGDLLFTVLLCHFGMSHQMKIHFSEMVGANVILQLDDKFNKAFCLNDKKGKTYLKISRSEGLNTDQSTIEKLIRAYVGFSGQNFPDILVPLFRKYNVMINVDRPIVIYQSMAFNLKHFNFPELSIKLNKSKMAISGKRAYVTISFEFISEENIIGSGEKKLILGGLRPYEENEVSLLTKMYQSRRNEYQLQQQKLISDSKNIKI